MKWYLKVLRDYAKFNGRARRSEFWYFILFTLLISLSLEVIGLLVHFMWLDTIYTLATLIPTIAVSVRRMHDVGKSGWFNLIPVYGIILSCQAGDIGNNLYGPDPKN